MALEDLVQEVRKHLDEVSNAPSTTLDERLLDHIDRRVTESIDEPHRDALLNQLSALLPSIQQDPKPVTNLIQRLIVPDQYDFSRALAISPPVDFLAGLTTPLPSINITTLCLLEKAKMRTSDIGILAGKPDVVGAMVRLWLCTQDTAVARKVHDVILGLLLADVESEEKMGSSFDSGIMESGLMWRRIFRDKDIYGSIFSICSVSTSGEEGQPSKRDKTVAQARLLDMVLEIDSETIRTSQIAEVEQRFDIEDGGLLHYAALHMVDYKDDVLMHMTLLDFLTKYLSATHKTIPSAAHEAHEIPCLSSYNLTFLRNHGLHDRSMAFFLYPEGQDPLDLGYLYGSSAHYLSSYCSTYPQDLLRPQNQHLAENILSRLTTVLRNVSSGHWAQGQIPKHDLHILASVPRIMLVPRAETSSPLFLIPVTPPSESAFRTLAHVFHGSEEQAATGTDGLSGIGAENAAARALFYFYVDQSSTFWPATTNAANSVAVKDTALAAINLIGSIITARWSPLPSTNTSSDSPFTLPSEAQLAFKCHASTSTLPATGIEAIMTEPALATVLPFLMKPPQTFSNLVGGGRGDVESAAYKVAAAKHDVLVLLHGRLKEWVGGHPEGRSMVDAVEKRIRLGVMGEAGDVGGRVGTLEL
ncbi:hypothetical protein MMC21_006008 [Puttea exsequens]|nr:hypothetical protein [Puttea exsequens]